MFRYIKLVFVFVILCSMLLNTGCFNSKSSNDDKKNLDKWVQEQYKKEDQEIKKLEPKANAGDKFAQLRIGALCLENAHLNYDKAFKYLKMSAEQGNDDSQLLLGDMYHHGWGTTKSNSEAFKLYNKSAEQGNIIARDNLIALYLEGNGIEKDYQKAINSLKKLADQEDMFVEYMIFYLYEPILGEKQDYKRAFKWFSNPKESYYQNYDLFRYCLAYMYENGLGTDKDEKKEKYWYDKIGDKDTIKRFKKMKENPLEDIQHTLGIIYYNTAYYRFDKWHKDFKSLCSYGLYGYKQALSYYTESAEQGNNDSYLLLHDMYYYYKKDKKEAFNCLIKAADYGNIKVMNDLGYIYSQGDKDYGVEKDYKKAFECFLKSAEQESFKDESIIALNNIGVMYENGLGVEKDINKALEYYKKSAEKGYEQAKKNYERLNKN